MIVEFPAFVLIGVYFPANSMGDRDDFRIGFMIALDARIRNLVALGKRVVLAGDLNVIREPIDTANAEEQMKKNGVIAEEYVSASPIRRTFNHLLVDGKVIGDRDEGREKGVLWDICRLFHPDRKGMFTCWEQKINARPGNFGSRIDYVLCSDGWQDWFCKSNIQEGLMGSDHCPVYAVIKDRVKVGDTEVHISDLMNPEGMFRDGIRLREWCQKDLLPASAKLIPEFDRRRSIRDMFTRKPSLQVSKSMSAISTTENGANEDDMKVVSEAATSPSPTMMAENSSTRVEESQQSTISRTATPTSSISSSISQANGRLAAPPTRPSKRNKASSIKTVPSNSRKGSEKGQSSLMGFFKPKTPTVENDKNRSPSAPYETSSYFSNKELPDAGFAKSPSGHGSTSKRKRSSSSDESVLATTNGSPSKSNMTTEKDFIDTVAAKESWSKLLSKRVVPKCEHNEPCASMLTKKPGVNCGRSFFMCPRPMGPSGVKEKGTEWRCPTFIWSSDWTKSGAN